MKPNGPVRIHLVSFVHSLSYILIRVHLVPNDHLAGDPLELPQGTPWGPRTPALRTNAVGITFCLTLVQIHIFKTAKLQASNTPWWHAVSVMVKGASCLGADRTIWTVQVSLSIWQPGHHCQLGYSFVLAASPVGNSKCLW